MCKIEGCNRKHEALGFCKLHYNQYKRGYEFSLGEYSFKATQNIIVEKKNYAEIILWDKRGRETGRALIDKEDIPLVKCFKWYLNSKGYVFSGKGGYLHRLIMQVDANDPLEIDHSGHNKLDNRKLGLRKCYRKQNSWNTDIKTTNSSGYKGVSWNKLAKKWEAYITFNGKRKYLKLHTDIKEAAKAYNEAAIKYFGEFAVLNEVR